MPQRGNFPGNYSVGATLQAKKRQRSVGIATTTHAKGVVGFDVPVDQVPGSAPSRR